MKPGIKPLSEQTYFDLFHMVYDEFEATQPKKLGRPFKYSNRLMILLFLVMQLKRKYEFRSMERYLRYHPEVLGIIGLDEIPHYATLSRRYKKIYPTLQNFIMFTALWAERYNEFFSNEAITVDGSFFCAAGFQLNPRLWREGIIPENARRVDLTAAINGGGYHRKQYGHKLHLAVNQSGLPTYCTLTPGNEPEIDEFRKMVPNLLKLNPKYFIGDNGYQSKDLIDDLLLDEGILLMNPAATWKNDWAPQYKHMIASNKKLKTLYLARSITIEPKFDLLSKIMGVRNNHKQLPVLLSWNAQTFIALAVIALQLVMITNYRHNRGLCEIGDFLAIFG